MSWLARIFRRTDHPSLASGLTLAQWDELYGELAHRRLFAKLRKVAAYSFVISLALFGIIQIIAVPGQKAKVGLDLLLLVFVWSIGVFAVTGGLVLWKWLVDRYGDRPTFESTEGKNRGKYRTRRK